MGVTIFEMLVIIVIVGRPNVYVELSSLGAYTHQTVRDFMIMPEQDIIIN
jgi:hypothetical protein